MTRCTNHLTLLFVFMSLVLLTCPAICWQPFLNDYKPPALEKYHTQQDIIAATRQKDISIADHINHFVLTRLQNGQYSNPKGSGYPYSNPPQDHSAPRIYAKDARWTPFDRYGSLYAQRNRLPRLSEVAKQRLEDRGFQVQQFSIFDNGKGVYIKWEIEDPSARAKWGDGWKFLEERLNPPPPTYEQIYGSDGERNLDGQDAGEPDVFHQMKNLIKNSRSIFQ
jgi:hypothetical protein